MTVHQKRGTLRCSACVDRKGEAVRLFRVVPIGARPVKIVLPVARVLCHDCGRTRQVRIPFADPRRSFTKGFERYALELLRHMTIQDVAAHLGVGWDLIKEIQKRHLQRHFSRPRLKHLKQIAIDEISVGRGHRYLTVVLDLHSGAVVFVGDGKGADAARGRSGSGCVAPARRSRRWPPTSRRRISRPCASICPTRRWCSTASIW